MNDPAEPPVIKARSAWWDWLAAFLVGALGWWLACRLSGKQEAWDSEYYGKISYPVFVLGAAVLGYLRQTHPWRWPLAIALGQAAVMFASGPIGNLAPLGLIAFLIFSTPLLVPAVLGGRLRNWRENR